MYKKSVLRDGFAVAFVEAERVFQGNPEDSGGGVGRFAGQINPEHARDADPRGTADHFVGDGFAG